MGSSKTRYPGLECSQSSSPSPLVHVLLQAADPTVLLVDLPDGQDAVEHALQHAAVHGDHRVPQRRLGDARPLGLQVEHIAAVPQALRTAGREEGQTCHSSFRASDSLVMVSEGYSQLITASRHSLG